MKTELITYLNCSSEKYFRYSYQITDNFRINKRIRNCFDFVSKNIDERRLRQFHSFDRDDHFVK